MNKKNYFWNNLRGILILLIVFAQFLYTYALALNGSAANVIYKLLIICCIPAFVFSLGYITAAQKLQNKVSQISLLLYYLLFNTAMALMMYFVKGEKFFFLFPKSPYWLVMSLILWRALAEPLSKIKGIIPIAAAAALLMGFWGEFSNILSIRRTVAYFFFFLLGYKFDRKKFLNMLKARCVKKYLLALVLTCIGIIALIYIVKNYNITISMIQIEEYKKPIELIYRAFLMAASVCAIISLMMITPNANIAVLTTLGKNSMLIYLAHRFVVIAFTYIFSYENYTNIYLLYAAIGTIVVCVLFGDNRINRFVDGVAEKTALHIVNDDKTGKILKTGIFAGVLLIMAVIPIIGALKG